MKKIKSEETTTGAIAPSRYASLGATNIKGNYVNHANREEFAAVNKQSNIRKKRKKKLMINASTKRAKNENLSLERIYDLVNKSSDK